MSDPHAAPGGATAGLRRVVFVGQTPATDAQQAIVQRLSAAANAAGDLTGLLIHCDGRFLQCLEGPAQNVARVLAGVRQNPLHETLVVLLDEPAPARLFANSGGGQLGVDSASWRRLLEADWPTMSRLDPDSPSGLSVLEDLARHPMGSAAQEAHSHQATREQGQRLRLRNLARHRLGRREKVALAVGGLVMTLVLAVVGRS